MPTLILVDSTDTNGNATFSITMKTGFTVSIVTNEPSVMEAFVRVILLVVEFVTVIENVAFPFGSVESTSMVKLALPFTRLLVNSLFRNVPVAFVRSELSVYNMSVMVWPARAKLLLEELEMVSLVMSMSGASVTRMVLVMLGPVLPA